MNILSAFINFNSLQIIGVLLREESTDYFLMETKKTTKKLLITATNHFSEMDNLVKSLNNSPKIIVIDGKGVLNKKIILGNENDTVWMKNLDYSAVHHMTLTSEDYNFISFCRKNVAEDIVATFQAHKFSVIDLYIGPLVSSLLQPLIGNDEIFTNDTRLTFDKNNLIDINKHKGRIEHPEYKIGDEELSHNFLALYGAALNYYINDPSLSRSNTNLINREEILYKKAFTQLGIGSIVTILILLLASYFTINYYNNQNALLNIENIYLNETYEQIIALEKEKVDKLKILSESGSLSPHFHSYYSFEISKSVPDGINLIQMNIVPLKKEVKGNEKVIFDVNNISIKGQFTDELIFNIWIENLRKSEWIKTFEIISLQKDKKNISKFELKIAVTDV